MNYKQKQTIASELRSSFNPAYPKGCVKITSGEAQEHRLVKFLVCSWLTENKYDFWTEANLNDGSRADIICIKGHIGYIIEIMHSESEKKYQEKMGKMYGNFMVIPVRTKGFKYEDFCI